MVIGLSAAGIVMIKDGQAQGLGMADTVNHSDLGRRLHLNVDGWANFGFTFNPAAPGDRYNGPVTFNDRDREVQMNQLYLLMERRVDKTAGNWDVGGRIDFLFGSDGQFAQAQGAQQGHWDMQLTDNRFYNIALPQAYAELYAPWGNGLSAKIGHFYTIIGNESVMAPDNFFYSHSYTMQYGEPFTHTGVLFEYPLLPAGSDALSGWTINTKLGAITGGTTGGWDAAFDHGLGAWRLLGGVSINSMEGDTSFDATASSGPTSEQNPANWSLYSLVLKHQFATAAHYAVQFDHGRVERAVQPAAEWMGLVNNLTYAFDPELTAGVRLEWFRDDNNFRVLSPAREGLAINHAGSYYAVTVGLKWQATGQLTLRPNARYDWSDGSRPFDSGNSATQWLLSLDCTLRF